MKIGTWCHYIHGGSREPLALTALASVLLSRRLTGPMRRFADAADRVGRGRRATLPAGA